jgi:hypothetical protein
MKTCDVWGLSRLLSQIADAQIGVKPWVESEDRDEIVPQEGLELYATGIVFHAQHLANELGLQSTYDRVWQGGGAFYLISNHLTWQQLSNELTVLRQSIEADLEKHFFVHISPEKASVIYRLKDSWESVWTAIQDARYDIEEANDCYALGKNTASVFHSMRIVEWGLRAFAEHLGFTEVKKGEKNGVDIVEPVEYATWDRILGQLRKHANGLIDAVTDRMERQSLQEFYNSALSEIEGFKDAWRNHVMHTRRSYSAEDAVAVLTHVQRFMRLLVTKGVVKHENKL